MHTITFKKIEIQKKDNNAIVFSSTDNQEIANKLNEFGIHWRPFEDVLIEEKNIVVNEFYDSQKHTLDDLFFFFEPRMTQSTDCPNIWAAIEYAEYLQNPPEGNDNDDITGPLWKIFLKFTDDAGITKSNFED